MGDRRLEEKRITADRMKAGEQIRELIAYRELVLTLAKKNFIVRYKQTILGYAWAFLQPLVTALVMGLAFGRILGLSSDGLPGMLFYLCNTAVWGFFAENVRANAKTFTANAYLFGKVYFPRMVMPLSTMLLNMVTFGIQMMMVLLCLCLYAAMGRIPVQPLNWIFLIPLTVQVGVLGMSIGIAISSLTTRYRDLVMLVEFGLQLWMYVTPVVYPLSQIGNPALLKLLQLNPMAMPMELFRLALFGRGTISGYGLMWCLVCTVIVLLAAVSLFNRVERTFMDTV